jgi:hypothetical protein
MKQLGNKPQNKDEQQDKASKSDDKGKFLSWVKVNRDSLKNKSLKSIKSTWDKGNTDKAESPKPDKNNTKLKILQATLATGLALGVGGKYAPLPNYAANFRDYIYQQGENRTEKDFTTEQISSIKEAVHNKFLIHQAIGEYTDKVSDIVSDDDTALKILKQDYTYTMDNSDEIRSIQYRDFPASDNQAMFGKNSKNPMSWFDGSMTPGQQVLVQLGRFRTNYSPGENGDLILKIHDTYDFQIKLDASAKQVTKATTLDNLKEVATESFEHAKTGNVLKTAQTLATLTGKPFENNLEIFLGQENASIYKQSQNSLNRAKKWLAEHKDIKIGEENNMYGFMNTFTNYLDKKSGLDTSKEMETIRYFKLASDLENYLEEKKGLTKKQIYMMQKTNASTRTLASFGDIDTPHIVIKAANLIIEKGADNHINEYYKKLETFKTEYNKYIAEGLSPKQIYEKLKL